MACEKGNISSATPPPALFQEGINLILSRWTALQLAVQYQSGGPHSHLRPQQLAHDLFSLLTLSKKEVCPRDVGDILEDAMDSLNTEVKDDSIKEVSRIMVHMHKGWMAGDFSYIEWLKATKPAGGIVSPCVEASSESDDDYDDDEEEEEDENLVNGGSSMMIDEVPASDANVGRAEMETDKCNTQSVEAQDGWIVVAPKRNRGRRN